MIKRLLVFTFLIGISATAMAQTDSLGVEKKGEQLLVLHKVRSGQTLYALARRYGATVQAIQTENPSLQQGLKVGQTIKIPYGKPIPVTREVSEPAKTHTVSRGETLYAISRKYGVSVDELKKLNNMTSNNLSLGQKLTIAEAKVVNVPVAPEETVKPETQEVTEADPEESRPLQDQNNAQAVDTTTTTEEPETTPPATEEIKEAEPVNYGGTKLEEINEEGVAELIEEEEPTTKFLALHKTAKVGTVIKIRNLKNDLIVYVRVVGQIPDTADNENILIKINKRAHDQLKAIDPRLRVELSYFH